MMRPRDEWLVGLDSIDEYRVSLLWMVGRGLCRSREEFLQHFQRDQRLERELDRFVELGHLKETDGQLEVCRIGRAVLGDLDPAVRRDDDEDWGAGTGASEGIRMPADYETVLPSDVKDPRVGPLSREDVVAVVEATGRYKFAGELGYGAMAQVVLCEQLEPVRRKVAIKVSETDNPALLLREGRIMSSMRHDCIPAVFDVDETSTRSFVVMEYVQGAPITAYCNDNALTIDERVALFLDVCTGVRHVHERGFIHCDLKPGNIFVVNGDAESNRRRSPVRPATKIFDFGLARSVDAPDDVEAEYFGPGTVQGTPGFMSPEQFDPELPITPSSDVYALGVILHELVTGAPPWSEEVISAARKGHTTNMFSGVPKASRSFSGPSQSERAKKMSSTPGEVRRRLLTDLDWVVEKAHEPSPERRYRDVAELIDDLALFLRKEPVNARPFTPTYALAKMAQRQRVGVVAVLVSAPLMLLLAMGLWIAILDLEDTTLVHLRAAAQSADADYVVEDLVAVVTLNDAPALTPDAMRTITWGNEWLLRAVNDLEPGRAVELWGGHAGYLGPVSRIVTIGRPVLAGRTLNAVTRSSTMYRSSRIVDPAWREQLALPETADGAWFQNARDFVESLTFVVDLDVSIGEVEAKAFRIQADGRVVSRVLLTSTAAPSGRRLLVSNWIAVYPGETVGILFARR